MNANANLLQGIQWHGFGTMVLLEAAVAHKRANRQWVNGNDAIAVLLNPQPFLEEDAYEDKQYNQDMGIKVVYQHHFNYMNVRAGGDHKWENYQSPCRKHGDNPRMLDQRYGVMKAQGNHVLDRETVYLEHFEVTGDLRCRRRLFFPPDVAAAIGAEPVVLLQYKRFPFCHPRAHRLELLMIVEAIEAAEAAAAAAVAVDAAAAAAAEGVQVAAAVDDQEEAAVAANAGAEAAAVEAAAAAAGGEEAAAAAAGGEEAAAAAGED